MGIQFSSAAGFPGHPSTWHPPADEAAFQAFKQKNGGTNAGAIAAANKIITEAKANKANGGPPPKYTPSATKFSGNLQHDAFTRHKA